MTEILTKSFGFVIIIILSYCLKSVGIFKKEDKLFLGALLLNVNLPCVIFTGFQNFQYDSSLVFAIFISMISSVLGLFIGYLISAKKDDDAKYLHMMGSAGYNIGIFTIPFVSSFLSSTAVIAALMFDIGNAIMVFGTLAAITSAVVRKEKTNPIPAIIKKLFTTIPFICYMFMIFIIVTGIKLPTTFYSIASIGADSTGYLAMVMIGIMLELNVKKPDLIASSTALFSRYLVSTIMAIFIYNLPFDIEIRKALIISVFSPLSTASLVFTEKLGCKPSILGVFSSLNIIISMGAIISIVIFLH